MDKIKKKAKQIWNSKCKYLVIVACALILMNGVNFLQTSLKLLNADGKDAEEIKSVEIESDGWKDKTPGSFHVAKSADWTGYKEATIRFDIDTTKKVVIEKNEEVIDGSGADIILVLDTSGSMNIKDRLVHLKEGATELVNEVLSEGDHQIALISFSDSATLRSTFTNDKNKMISQINSLSPGGGTSYSSAYRAVISLLSGYEQKQNRDLVMLFLTDGAGGTATSQYSILKEKYDITIVGIQYDMGTSIKSAIKKISDKQYLSTTTNITAILEQAIGEATNKIQVTQIMRAESYETFEVIDYIGKDFYVKTVDDIKVSIGTAKLERESDGTQKVIWTITKNDDFRTGTSIDMEIKVSYQGELNPDRVYPTNKKEEISYKLPEEERNSTISELTPQIRDGYYVTYDPNLPKECNPSESDLTTTKLYFAYETVDKAYGNYSCDGWQFKGWELDEDSYSSSMNDDEFILPSHDVKVTAIWTKIDLSKNMEGTIYEPVQELFIAMKENATTNISLDTAINFEYASSASNGRGLYIRSGTENDKNPIYYYRGAVTNNNVLFAGICWQIVRTTENGGIKLIYNGTSSDGKTCTNKETSNIGNSRYASEGKIPTSVGYMIGSNANIAYYNFASTDYLSYKYGNSVLYNASTNQYTITNDTTSKYGYTCKSSSKTVCETVYYRYPYTSYEAPGLVFSNGETLETTKQQMTANTHGSEIKKVIDSWYKEVINDKGYTKYLEDAIWCNDRTFNSNSFLVNGTASISFGRGLSSTYANPLVKDADVCPNVNDQFTTNSASSGNKVLMYPVGMLTADEVFLGGITFYSSQSSQDSYLYTGYSYWTITPYSWIVDITYYSVFDSGYMQSNIISNTANVRPSISLKEGTLVALDGDGTLEKPYVVITE